MNAGFWASATSMLPWLVTGLISFIIVTIYGVRFRRRAADHHLRFEETVSAGTVKPMGQFPYIDPSLCIGCGSCVSVCPEGDVLGLVGGQAIVINGARCIGIAACEVACPVGAIEVGLGDIRGRTDLPVLSDRLETSVPGVFIAGELGGLSLIRNAIEQGQRAAREVIQRLETSPKMSSGAPIPGSSRERDLLIIGIGPAGMSAALAASEANLDYLVLEQEPDLGGTIAHYPRKKIAHSQPVELARHGWLKKPEMSKEELLDLFSTLHRQYLLDICFGEKVKSIEPTESGVVVEATTGTFRSRYLILAIGRRGSPRKLGVPGEDLGKVFYQVRDAELHRDQKILCVGGGDSAVEAAMGLAAQRGNQVLLSYRKAAFQRIKLKNLEHLERAQTEGRLEVAFESSLLQIEQDRALVRFSTGPRWIANDLVFIFAGGEPPYPLLKDASVLFGDQLEPSGSPT